MNGSEMDYPEKGPTILIAADHNILRESLRDLITIHFQKPEIIEANSGWKALSKSLVYHPDLILMDLALPEMDGIEATRHIKKVFPEIYVVIMTMTEDPLYVVTAIAAGANNTIVKNRIDVDLVPVLTNLLAA